MYSSPGLPWPGRICPWKANLIWHYIHWPPTVGRASSYNFSAYFFRCRESVQQISLVLIKSSPKQIWPVWDSDNQVLYIHPSASIWTSGFLSNSFSITNGVQHGCPLPPIIFSLVKEPLAEHMCSNHHISGIKMGDVQHTIGLYAYDVLLYPPYESQYFSTKHARLGAPDIAKYKATILNQLKHLWKNPHPHPSE